MACVPAEFEFVADLSSWHDPTTLIVRIPRRCGKRALLAAFAAALRFPGYFGHNWDALEECLRDLSWLPAGQHIAIVHEGMPLPRSPRERKAYLAVLRDFIAVSCSERRALFPAYCRPAVLATLRDL